MTELEQRVAYLERMFISQNALLNVLITSILQNDGTLRSKVADDLRLMQIRLEKQVHPDFLDQISGLRSLLTARYNEASIAASLQPTLRLVDPPSE